MNTSHVSGNLKSNKSSIGSKPKRMYSPTRSTNSTRSNAKSRSPNSSRISGNRKIKIQKRVKSLKGSPNSNTATSKYLKKR